jgi:hypothetical protein
MQTLDNLQKYKKLLKLCFLSLSLTQFFGNSLSFLSFPPSCTSSSLIYGKSPRVDPGLHRFTHDVAVGEAMIQQLLAECPVSQFYLLCRKVKILFGISKVFGAFSWWFIRK